MLSRMRNTLPLVMAIVAAFAFTAGRASAQSTAATLSGTIKDATGASVPEAKITLSNEATRVSRTFETNDSGLFVAPDVDQGIYDLAVEKAGFKRLNNNGIAVNPQDRLSLGELTLQVGAPTDVVTVTADAGQIQQIHEVGVVSEIGVEPHRIGLHFLDRVGGSGGGQEQHVHAIPLRFGGAFEFTQTIFGFEGFDCGVTACAGDDFVDYRMHLPAMRV